MATIIIIIITSVDQNQEEPGGTGQTLSICSTTGDCAEPASAPGREEHGTGHRVNTVHLNPAHLCSVSQLTAEHAACL